VNKFVIALVLLGSCLHLGCAARKAAQSRVQIATHTNVIDSNKYSNVTTTIAKLDTTIVVPGDTLNYSFYLPENCDSNCEIVTSTDGGRHAIFSVRDKKLQAKIIIADTYVPVKSHYQQVSSTNATAQTTITSGTSVDSTSSVKQTERKPTSVKIINRLAVIIVLLIAALTIYLLIKIFK
jgi:hypothetical protein